MQKEVVIEALDHFGRGVVHRDGKPIFVPFALPGERCLIEIVETKKKYAIARLLQILSSSKDRVEPKCPYFKQCGGCQLLHLSKEGQAKFKEEKVKEILWKFAHIPKEKIQLIASSPLLAYRNKMTVHGEDQTLGFYEEKNHTIVPISTCPLMDPSIERIYQELCRYQKEFGGIKQAMIRVGNRTDEVIMVVEGNVKIDSFVSKFSPLVTSLYVNGICYSKKENIRSVLFDKTFFVSKDSFFQVNLNMTETLYGIVLDLVKKETYHHALDLYCGTGTIGMLLAPHVKQVTGIELIEDAVRDARENAKQNSLSNISFYQGKVEEVLPNLIEEVDLVVVDPPRKGLDDITISTINKRHPKTIVYISCDPVTLARDLTKFSSYEVDFIKPVDMFPNTYHVECVVSLSLVGKK